MRWNFTKILLCFLIVQGSLAQIKTITQTGVKRSMIRGDATTLTWTVSGDYSSDSLLFIAKDNNNDAVLRLTTGGGLTASYAGQKTTITATINAATTENFIAQNYLYDISSVTDSVTLIMGLLAVIADISNLEDTVVASIPYYTVPLSPPDYDTTFIWGHISDSTWEEVSINDVRSVLSSDGSVSVPDSVIYPYEIDTLFKKTSHIVNVMDYVDSYDTTGNWQPAIQAAIESLKPLIGLRTSGGVNFQVGVVVLPAMTMEIDSSINLYSGITLQGQGAASEFSEGSGFVGEQLITLYGLNDYVDNAKIKDIQLTTTTVRGIGCGSTTVDVIDCIIEGITFNAVQGIVLDEYTQATVIRDIYSYGNIDTLIYLEGNFNYIENVVKEGGTGAAVGAYIYLGWTSIDQPSEGNELHNILIEGNTSVNKSGIILRARQTTINNYWYESNFSDGYMLRVEGGSYNRITGFYMHVLSTQKTKIDSTQFFTIDFFSMAGESGKTFLERFEKDSSSTVIVKNMEYFGIIDNPLSVYNLNNGWVFDNVFSRCEYTDAGTGINPAKKIFYGSGNNLLVNGSFEAGQYQWLGTIDTIDFHTSEIDGGQMVRLVWDDTISQHQIYQNLTIPEELVGQSLTLTAFVKVTGGRILPNSWAYPYINGCGITLTSGFDRVYDGGGWHLLSQTFIPQSAGTLSVGVAMVYATEMYVDDVALSIGTGTILNSEKQGSVTLNGRTITYASVAPTTGTWKQGDIVFNSATDDEGYVGWVCTSAGTPGTWSQFGGTINTKGGLYERAVTITPTNTTSYALTVNGTQKTSGRTYGYHDLQIPLLHYTTDDTISGLMYTDAERVIDSIRYKMDDSVAFNIRYGANGTGTEIFTTPDTLIGSGMITSFDNSVIPIDNEAQLYFKFFGDNAVKQFLKIYYHDYDTVNVYAVNLNGTDEVLFDTVSSMDITGAGSEFSVMAWIKADDVTDNGIQIARRTNAYDYWQLQRSSGKPYFIFDDGSQKAVTASSAVSDSTWYNVVITISDSMRMYIDGVRQYGAGTTTVGFTEDFNDAPVFSVGAFNTAGAGYAGFGSNIIGEVQIINNHALTQAEITNAYNLTYAGGHYPSSYSAGDVVAWYKWSGDNDTVFLEDVSGFSNDLTGVNITKAGDQVIINGGYK